MASLTFVDRNSDLKEIESTVKNKFKWCWLDEKDSNGDLLSDYVRKLSQPGNAYCIFCKYQLNYSSRGRSFITRHASSQHHMKRRNDVKSNQSLPSSFQTAHALQDGSRSIMFASASSTQSTSMPINQPPKPPSPPSMKDRISHQEAAVCSFIAEHSLPLSIAPHLVGLAQLLSQDHKALQSLSMERQTCTYKLKYGLMELQHKRLVKQMQATPFSFNIDESTTKHGKKRVLNVMVCFYDSVLNKSVTHLYSALELFTVNAESVFSALVSKMKEDDIPLKNLMSVLSDSAAYMRGCNNGVFKKLKEIAPHIVDIDGDLCHHIHNVSKLFCSSFDKTSVIPFLLDDIFADFEYCPDLRQELFSICSVLNLNCLVPKQRIAYRWLNILDCCQRFFYLKDALILFYYSFLSANDKHLFHKFILDIFEDKEVSTDGQKAIFKVVTKVKSKSMTDQGKARKKRVCKKLFDFKFRTEFYFDVYNSVLPIFKKFILSFEKKTPQPHIIHDEQVSVFKSFLQFFVKPEYIRECDKDLASMNLSSDENFLSIRHIYAGEKQAISLVKDKSEKKECRTVLFEAFKQTAVYMQKKLPLNNPVLKALSALDPKVFGHAATAIALRKLPQYFPTIFAPNFDQEIMALQSDMDVKADEGCAVELWWGNIIKLKRYPSVEKIITACLSIFTGPRVEQSFSLMNNIISENASSLLISTYESYMYVKYQLLALDTTSLKYYRRPDAITSPVDSSMAYHMQTAASRHKKRKAASDNADGPSAKKAAVSTSTSH